MKNIILPLLVVSIFSIGKANAFTARCTPIGQSDDINLVSAYHDKLGQSFSCLSGKFSKEKVLSFVLRTISEYEVGVQRKSIHEGFVMSCPTVSKNKLRYAPYRWIRFLRLEAGVVLGTGIGSGFDNYGNPCGIIRGSLTEIGARTGFVEFEVEDMN